MPTPGKYANRRSGRLQGSRNGCCRKAALLLPGTEPSYRRCCLRTWIPRTAAAVRLVKAADRISAYIKCLDEEKAGNTEFRQAGESVRKKLDAVAKELPEMAWFMRELLPSFALSLDELS